jgi:hypothetical protein
MFALAHTYIHTHTRTHARTHARTHTHTRKHTWEGWRMQVKDFLPRWAPRAWHSPMVVVLLPCVGIWVGGQGV